MGSGMGSGMFVSAKLLAVPALFAVLLTLLLAPLLLLAYRRHVTRLMAAGSGAWPGDEPDTPTPVPAWQIVELAQPGAGDARTAAWRAAARAGQQRIAITTLGAGLAAALFITACFALAFAASLSASALLAGLAVFCLPVLATGLQLLVASPGRRVLAFAAALLAAYLLLGIARDLGQSLFTGFVLLPALLLFVFGLRFWRGVAPLLLPVLAGASLLWVLGAELARGGSDGLRWALRLLGFGLGAGLGWFALRALQARHEAGRLGDQQLFVDAWWLVYVVYTTAVFTMMKLQPGWFAVLLAFPLYLGVRRLLRAAWPAPATTPLRLLLLRVFDQGRRTERLFAQLEQDWRAVGSIALIAGRDLALRNIGPADMVAFLSGCLHRRFVAGAAALQQRLAADSGRRDPDGHFGVDHFWCHADTWRPVMRSLAARSDVVLMDLRGFGADRAGCAYELRHLARTARAKPVLLLVAEAAEADAVRALLGGHEQAGSPWCLARVGPTSTDLAPALFAALGGRLPA